MATAQTRREKAVLDAGTGVIIISFSHARQLGEGKGVGRTRVVTDFTKGISVSLINNAVHVRVVGRGTFQNGQPLRRYALEMMERGVQQFIVDLGGCDGMDSTFLGVLAGMGLRLSQNGRTGQVRVANIGQRNLELLETLGLDRLFGLDQPSGKNLRYEP